MKFIIDFSQGISVDLLYSSDYIVVGVVSPVLWVLTFIVVYYWKQIMFRIYLHFYIKPNERMDKVKDPNEFDYDVFISH